MAHLIPTALGINLCPPSGGDGPHDLWLSEEAVPGVAAGLDDGGVVLPNLEAEPVLAEILPDVLDGVELRAVGRQWQQDDVGWHDQGG